MHLGETGEIIPADQEERVFLEKARLNGMFPKEKYPTIPTATRKEQDRLIARLENGERAGDDALVRGLARMTISSCSDRARAIEWLTIIAESAVANRQLTLQ